MAALKTILEALLMASDEPLTLDRMSRCFAEHERPEKAALHAALDALANDYENRGIELKSLSSGYRFQAREDFKIWIARLWEMKPPRYSRATLETLAIIAYRQPVTRAEIEAIRGVAVSTNIIRNLEERDWIQVIGHRDVPGKPSLYGTTKQFLDDFNMSSLEALPSLPDIQLTLDPAAETH